MFKGMNTDENLQLETNLNELDKKIVEFKIENPAITNQEIADRLGLSRVTISKHFNSEGVQNYLKEHHLTTLDRFTDIREKALTRIEELIESSEDKVAVIACREFIRSIMPQKIEHSGHIVSEGRLTMIDYMSKEDIKNAIENMD